MATKKSAPKAKAAAPKAKAATTKTKAAAAPKAKAAAPKAKAAAPKAKAAAAKVKAAPKAQAAAPTATAAPHAQAVAPAAPQAVAFTAKNVPTTKTQIFAAIADASGITKAQAKTGYETLLAIAYAGAKAEKGITLPGLGKLIKVQRKAGMVRNPATGEMIKSPAKTSAKFRMAKACKDAVLAK